MNQALFIVWRESVEALLVIGILQAWVKVSLIAYERFSSGNRDTGRANQASKRAYQLTSGTCKGIE